jgi:hypothetical protein
VNEDVIHRESSGLIGFKNERRIIDRFRSGTAAATQAQHDSRVDVPTAHPVREDRAARSNPAKRCGGPNCVELDTGWSTADRPVTPRGLKF